MRYLSRKSANREWKQPKSKNCVVVNKAEKSWRSEEHLDLKQRWCRVWVCQAGFLSCFGPVFPYHGILECNVYPAWCWRYMIKGLQLKNCIKLKRDFELWTFNIVETVKDCGTLEVGLNVVCIILWLGMAPIDLCVWTSLWEPGSGMKWLEYAWTREALGDKNRLARYAENLL